jgi:hypothetical protein
MTDVLGDLGRAVFGDPDAVGLQGRVPSYEELHAEAQAILVPATYPAGLTVQLLQSLNKHFGLTHRCGLIGTASMRSIRVVQGFSPRFPVAVPPTEGAPLPAIRRPV